MLFLSYFVLVVFLYWVFNRYFGLISSSTVQLYVILGVITILAVLPIIMAIYSIRSLKGVNKSLYASEDSRRIDAIGYNLSLQNTLGVLVTNAKTLQSGTVNGDSDLIAKVYGVERLAIALSDALTTRLTSDAELSEDWIQYVTSIRDCLKEEIYLIQGLEAMPMQYNGKDDLAIINDTYSILLEKLESLRATDFNLKTN